jgi:hypothetical protein
METSYYAQFHTSAEAENIFAQVFGGRLAFCGFEAVGPRKWVQETGCGFKYFFFLNTGNKGCSYLPCGAISVDFVPRFVAGKFKLQPKPKHAAVHYSFGQKIHWEWSIDKSRENSREKVERIAGESVTEITAWFQRFKSLKDVVASIDQEKRQSKGSGFHCYYMMVLAYSFTLARVGRIADARSEFQHVFQSKTWDADGMAQLQELFEAEINRSDS